MDSRYLCASCIHYKHFFTTGRNHCVVYNTKLDGFKPCEKCENENFMNYKVEQPRKLYIKEITNE